MISCSHIRLGAAALVVRLLVLASLFGPAPEGMAEDESTREAYVIPIEGPIEKSLLYVFRRGLQEAERHEADAVIFDMDTPGGAVNVTEEIIQLIRDIETPTYTFVRANAISAGAIISLATDYIYMTPGSKIGDAMPIMMAPGGGAQSPGEDQQEKMVSYVDSLVRGVAQQTGRDEDLASAMVRRELEYKIGDEVICPEGQLLTLTDQEAAKVYTIDGEERPLLSEGTVEDFDAFLGEIGLADATIHRLEITGAERLARFISMIAPFLLTIGFLALYLEFQTPGFGAGAAVGIACLALFFLGHHIAGLAGMEEILIFILGVALLVVELLFVPGFGFIGMIGILLMFYGLLMGMVENLPERNIVQTLPELQIPFMTVLGSFVAAGVLAIAVGRHLPKSRAFHRLVLDSSTSRDEGFQAAAEDTSPLVGEEGVATSDLHPSGSGRFGDRYLDIISRGEYVKRGTPIRIAEAHGNRLVVEPVDTPSEEPPHT